MDARGTKSPAHPLTQYPQQPKIKLMPDEPKPVTSITGEHSTEFSTAENRTLAETSSKDLEYYYQECGATPEIVEAYTNLQQDLLEKKPKIFKKDALSLPNGLTIPIIRTPLITPTKDSPDSAIIFTPFTLPINIRIQGKRTPTEAAAAADKALITALSSKAKDLVTGTHQSLNVELGERRILTCSFKTYDLFDPTDLREVQDNIARTEKYGPKLSNLTAAYVLGETE